MGWVILGIVRGVLVVLVLVVLVVLVVSWLLVGWSILVLGVVGVGGVCDHTSIDVGVGGGSKLSPQSRSITGYFNLALLFFLLELVGGR